MVSFINVYKINKLYDMTDKRIESKITIDYIVNLIQTVRLNSFLNKIINGPERPVIIGSYVYKYLIRGEKITSIHDIDVICNNPMKFSMIITRKEELGYIPNEYQIFFSGSELYIDVIPINMFADEINEIGLTTINSLVFSNGEIKHIFEIPEIANKLNVKATNPEKERTWMVDNLKANRYCRWSGMRQKDVEYFNDWKVIDFQECALHGIYDRHQ